MFKRFSHVNRVRVDTVYNSSIFQIGDSKEIHTRARGLAVFRDKPVYWGKEGDFQQFAIFQRPPALSSLPDSVILKKEHKFGSIHVKDVYVSGLSGSALLHIGSTEHMVLESRLKHIRHLIRNKKKEERKICFSDDSFIKDVAHACNCWRNPDHDCRRRGRQFR